MAAIVDCPACRVGEHDGHIGPWNVRDGVLGGVACGCFGDCVRRNKDRFVLPLPPDLPTAGGTAGGDTT